MTANQGAWGATPGWRRSIQHTTFTGRVVLRQMDRDACQAR